MGDFHERSLFGKVNFIFGSSTADRESATRWLNLVVTFPAVKSRGRPALADPLRPVGGSKCWRQS
jgi:hypothetical protein